MSQAFTFAQLRQAVVDATGRTDKLSVINTGLNLGLSELSQLYDWRDLRVQTDLTVNQNDLSFNLPSDFYQIVEIRLINGALSYPLMIVPKEKFTKTWANVTALGSGRPWIAYEELGVIYIAPKSSASYPMRTTYIRLHPPLVLDQDLLLIQVANSAIIAYGTYWLFQTLGMFVDAQAWRAVFEGEAQRAILADQRRPGVVLQAEEYQTDRT